MSVVPVSQANPPSMERKLTRMLLRSPLLVLNMGRSFSHGRFSLATCVTTLRGRGVGSTRRPMLMVASHGGSTTPVTTNEDRYVVSCLLMLANGRIEGYEELGHQGLFECTSCKKVFGSHQALGGHRASHKNVKGCFAIMKNEGGEEGEVEGHLENSNMMMIVCSSSSEQHKCNICLQVFSSGHALGGHKRYHWEKDEDDVVVQAASISVVSQGPYRLALNFTTRIRRTKDADF